MPVNIRLKLLNLINLDLIETYRLECESVNYDLVLSYSDWPTIYYCELLLNTSSFISDRYSHLTTLDEKCAAIKKSMLRLNIFYDAIEYTRIEEWPKMYLQVEFLKIKSLLFNQVSSLRIWVRIS